MLSPRPFGPGTGSGSGSASRPADATGPGGGPVPDPGAGPCTGSGPADGSGSGSASVADGRRAMELLAQVPHGRLAASMRALPLLAVARHQVIEGRVFLRLHRGLGYHECCDGNVIAYGADNVGFPGLPASSGTDGLWAVQCTGPAELTEPTPGQRDLFGAGPLEVNGEPFDPVYLRLDPHVVRMHTLAYDASP
ncbi:hypothetical protein GA0115239_100545 [Streptomyces sp. BpilaLS-43]|uniref:hypothetical protein n=1 Tax=Streptomyces sp. BpilaLS-43 TaxID=1839778 RepID=UPI00081B58A9|nr:hypothetical protein GA0115239_100545 [Streptomyces sp. BpilaLS-43]